MWKKQEESIFFEYNFSTFLKQSDYIDLYTTSLNPRNSLDLYKTLSL